MVVTIKKEKLCKRNMQKVTSSLMTLLSTIRFVWVFTAPQLFFCFVFTYQPCLMCPLTHILQEKPCIILSNYREQMLKNLNPNKVFIPLASCVCLAWNCLSVFQAAELHCSPKLKTNVRATLLHGGEVCMRPFSTFNNARASLLLSGCQPGRRKKTVISSICMMRTSNLTFRGEKKSLCFYFKVQFHVKLDMKFNNWYIHLVILVVSLTIYGDLMRREMRLANLYVSRCV